MVYEHLFFLSLSLSPVPVCLLVYVLTPPLVISGTYVLPPHFVAKHIPWLLVRDNRVLSNRFLTHVSLASLWRMFVVYTHLQLGVPVQGTEPVLELANFRTVTIISRFWEIFQYP